VVHEAFDLSLERIQSRFQAFYPRVQQARELLVDDMSTIFTVIVLLALTALGATVYLFHRRRFDPHGFRKGTAANPDLVRRQNPPD
jgi:hypothetical protein